MLTTATRGLVGQIRLEGDRGLINHVAKALLRPSDDVHMRMQHATKRNAPAYACRDLVRVHRPSELEILERIEASEPFIATGLDLPTPCSAWSLALLAQRYGDLPLRVRSATERETVAEFVQRVEVALEAERTGVATRPLIDGATKAYTEGCTLPEAMRADFMPQHFCLDNYIEPQIWLGAVPTNVHASSLHRDPMDGFLFQIMGRKRLVLFAPNQADRLYPMKAWNNYQPCWVKPEAPDLKTFSEFANAQALEVVLQPGELLIQPAGWFHAVYCLDSPTFSVSYFLKH
jgi:Cupin-like domain